MIKTRFHNWTARVTIKSDFYGDAIAEQERLRKRGYQTYYNEVSKVFGRFVIKMEIPKGQLEIRLDAD